MTTFCGGAGFPPAPTTHAHRLCRWPGLLLRCSRSRSRLLVASGACLVSSRLRSGSGVGRAGVMASSSTLLGAVHVAGFIVTVLGFGGPRARGLTSPSSHQGAKAGCVGSRRALSWFFPSSVRDDLLQQFPASCVSILFFFLTVRSCMVCASLRLPVGTFLVLCWVCVALHVSPVWALLGCCWSGTNGVQELTVLIVRVQCASLSSPQVSDVPWFWHKVLAVKVVGGQGRRSICWWDVSFLGGCCWSVSLRYSLHACPPPHHNHHHHHHRHSRHNHHHHHNRQNRQGNHNHHNDFCGRFGSRLPTRPRVHVSNMAERYNLFSSGSENEGSCTLPAASYAAPDPFEEYFTPAGSYAALAPLGECIAPELTHDAHAASVV